MSHSPQPARSKFRPLRALVVHRGRRGECAELILDILGDRGCEASVYADIDAALSDWDGARADLLVMDAEVEAREPERAEKLYRKLGAPVIYLCGERLPATFQAHDQAIGYLVSPLDRTYSAAVIDRALRGPGRMA